MASPRSPIMASLLFSFLFVFIALTSAADTRMEANLRTRFEAWMLRQGKVYNSLSERERRFEIFKDNLKFINERNAMNLTYKLGLTRFADLTNEEYRSRYLRRVDESSASRASDRYAFQAGEYLPESVDWREKGAVLSYVKHQGECGSCWTFSAVAAVEGINAIITGQLISLSEQQILDCSTGSYGCDGGYIDKAFEYISNNGGIDTEDDYPYIGFQSQCNPYSNKVVTIHGYEMVPRYDERSLQKAVANQPVSVTIEAGGSDFQHYQSGVFTGSCGNSLDHAVVAVGYGSDDGSDYWIVRNSWGSDWGENGYIRMQRNVGNAAGICGIAMQSYYPTKIGQDIPNPIKKVAGA